MDPGQFSHMVGSLRGANYTKQLEEAFKTIDKEGGGYIMASELRHLLTHMGDRITDDEFNTLLAELDVDSNGRVGFKGEIIYKSHYYLFLNCAKYKFQVWYS